MPIRHALAQAYWAVSRWRLVREQPRHEGPRLLIGAPHTSNWDFVLMLGIAWDARLEIRWLGKRELFRGPAGPIMRALGGIPVDRKDPAEVVAHVLEIVRGDPNAALVVTPDGTRGRAEHWRSGFYRIARGASLPVTLGFVDRTTMTAGLGPTLVLTGDVAGDMQRIRDFYADKAGLHASGRTEPRLRDESGMRGSGAERP